MTAAKLARRARTAAWLALAGVVAAPAGWVASDVVESRNDFCNACHLSADVPLHIDVRRHFDGAGPATLAAAHGAARVEARPGASAFRCIDCHGGTSLVGRARVKALAAKDAFWWMVGDFEEPEGMRWPLWDEDCRKCHASFEKKAGPFDDPAFHDLGVHNSELGVACVECHLVHETGAEPEAWSLHPSHVRHQCARCHAEYEQFAASSE